MLLRNLPMGPSETDEEHMAFEQILKFELLLYVYCCTLVESGLQIVLGSL